MRMRASGVVGRQYDSFGNRKAGGGFGPIAGKGVPGGFPLCGPTFHLCLSPLYLWRHPWEHTVVSDGDLFSKLSLSWYPAVGEERS